MRVHAVVEAKAETVGCVVVDECSLAKPRSMQPVNAGHVLALIAEIGGHDAVTGDAGQCDFYGRAHRHGANRDRAADDARAVGPRKTPELTALERCAAVLERNAEFGGLAGRESER